MNNNKNEIMIYEDKDGITKVNVKFINEDIWLTQNQLAEIYKTTQQNISQHINSIYKDNELELNSTNKKFLLVQKVIDKAVLSANNSVSSEEDWLVDLNKPIKI